MKKLAFIILVLGISFSLASCGKKQATLEESQEPVSIETLSMLNTQAQGIGESKPPTQATQVAPAAGNIALAVPVKPEVALPVVSAKPTTEDVQTALKNAGLYIGNIDGKKGPMTKKAIEDFQKANGLAVDGKVGLKTWGLLSAHLNPAPSPSAATPEKKKR